MHRVTYLADLLDPLRRALPSWNLSQAGFQSSAQFWSFLPGLRLFNKYEAARVFHLARSSFNSGLCESAFNSRTKHKIYTPFNPDIPFLGAYSAGEQNKPSVKYIHKNVPWSQSTFQCYTNTEMINKLSFCQMQSLVRMRCIYMYWSRKIS